jgi:hypothetical protein
MARFQHVNNHKIVETGDPDEIARYEAWTNWQRLDEPVKAPAKKAPAKRAKS